MPDLPASRRKILADSKLAGDLGVFSEALVVEHKTDFVVGGKTQPAHSGKEAP